MVDILLVDIISFPVYYFGFTSVFTIVKRVLNENLYNEPENKGGGVFVCAFCTFLLIIL